MNEAMGLTMSTPVTVDVAVRMTAPAATAVTVDMAAVTVGMAMNMRMAVHVAMYTDMAVPLRMNTDRGLVAPGQRHTGDDADRDADRQRAVVIGPRRRCGQNSDEKRCEEDCAHPVPSFREARKPHAVRRPRSTGSRLRPVDRQDRAAGEMRPVLPIVRVPALLPAVSSTAAANARAPRSWNFPIFMRAFVPDRDEQVRRSPKRKRAAAGRSAAADWRQCRSGPPEAGTKRRTRPASRNGKKRRSPIEPPNWTSPGDRAASRWRCDPGQPDTVAANAALGVRLASPARSPYRHSQADKCCRSLQQRTAPGALLRLAIQRRDRAEVPFRNARCQCHG